MQQSYYDTLGVDSNASPSEIKQAFRKKARKHHPDMKGGDASIFRSINEAYMTLSDSSLRFQYDVTTRMGEASSRYKGIKPEPLKISRGRFDLKAFFGADYGEMLTVVRPDDPAKSHVLDRRL